MALNADEVSAYAGAIVFGNLVLSICGTMLKLTFVVSSYVVVGVALPIALALVSLQGLGRFLHYVIMQPKQPAAGGQTLRKALKKVARRLDKKRRKALRPLRCSLGKHFLFWQRCTKIFMQCVDWIFLSAKLFLFHCALLLLADTNNKWKEMFKAKIIAASCFCRYANRTET